MTARRATGAAAALLTTCLFVGSSADARQTDFTKVPTATGTGAAVATVDALATKAALDVLRKGGNAVDAAVTAAGVLGVTEPFSCGIGGGGFFVYYDADRERVHTIDGREAAPASFDQNAFIDPATGKPIPFAEAVTSGLSVGVPGTLRTWETALRRWGTYSLARTLAPGERIARRGFEVDQTFADQVEANRSRFARFTSTRETYLDADGTAPDVGSIHRNRDLADTYDTLAEDGVKSFYRGDLADSILEAVQTPPVASGQTDVRPGKLTASDLRRYKALLRTPTAVDYRGLRVYGMAPPSSGGSTVGEALNILEGFDLRSLTREAALHRYLEASRLAFADRGAYLGDPGFVDIPLRGLLSDGFAAQRRGLIGEQAQTSPVAAGDPYPFEGRTKPAAARASTTSDRLGSTTHLTVSDAGGNVVSYTFTIEQTGGSGIVVPDAGFLLNNELTDFDFQPPSPNQPGPRKRPRSSMAPTIVLDRFGEPVVALGSPGGSTIITTVLQVLMEDIDLGKSLPEAIAAPRLSQRNGSATNAEPAFLGTPEAGALQARGHRFATTPEIGAVTGIAFGRRGQVTAAAEPARRGGGSAGVVAQPSDDDRGKGKKKAKGKHKAKGKQKAKGEKDD